MHALPLLDMQPIQEGGHHELEEYATRGKEPQDEVQMYTWMDATLRELSDLVKEVQTAARNPRARLQFALVYPDRQGKNVLRQVCCVIVCRNAHEHAGCQVGSVHATRHGPDDLKTLKAAGFQVWGMVRAVACDTQPEYTDG